MKCTAQPLENSIPTMLRFMLVYVHVRCGIYFLYQLMLFATMESTCTVTGFRVAIFDASWQCWKCSPATAIFLGVASFCRCILANSLFHQKQLGGEGHLCTTVWILWLGSNCWAFITKPTPYLPFPGVSLSLLLFFSPQLTKYQSPKFSVGGGGITALVPTFCSS